MMLLRASLAITSMFLITACADVPTSASTGTVTAEIIGTQRSASAYPEAVTIKVNNADDDFCTGTVVAPRVVLTAAHCVIFNTGGTWTVVAPYAAAQSRTVTQAEKIDSGFPSTGYDDQDTYRDLGFLYPDKDLGFNAIAFPTLSRTTSITGTSVSAIGRKTVSAGAGLALSSATPLLSADPGYPNDYRTKRLTDGGDSGGGLFLEGTHTLIGSERLFDEGTVKDFWVEYSGTTYDAILARIASHGGYVNLSPTSATLAPLGSQAFTVSAGAGGTYTYSVSTNHSGGSIDATGAYKAGPTGSVSDVVTATDSANRTGSVTVVVGAAISMAPATATIPPRGAVTFAAKDGSGGYAYTIPTNHSGGTIAAGHYIAGAAGSTSDVVHVVDTNGATADATVTVTAGVSITPSNPSTLIGGHVALAASGGSGAGFTWSVTKNDSGASVDAAGSYTAGATGPVTDQVTATDALGNTRTVTITVGLPLSIKSSPTSLPPRGTVALAPSGGSGHGYVWTVSTNASGATIDANGNYTAGPKGNVNDIVTLVDSDGTTVTNEESVTAELAITPGDSTLAAGGTLSFSATGRRERRLHVHPRRVTVRRLARRPALHGRQRGSTTDVVTAHDPLGNSAITHVTVLRAPTPDAGPPSAAPSDAGPVDGASGSGPITSVPDAASAGEAAVAANDVTPEGGCNTTGHDAPVGPPVLLLGALLFIGSRRRRSFRA